MSDFADNANEAAELFLSQAIAARKALSLRLTGHCHYCSEPCQSRAFCDIECRDAFDEEQRIRAATRA